MIRRIADFVYIILFVWASMIIGLWMIAAFIVPLEIPGLDNPIIVGTLKVTVSLALAVAWLWAWREIVRREFWRAIRKRQHYINDP